VLPSVVNIRTVGLDGSKAEASGIVIDRRGVILTNNHVVEGAGRLTVTFEDGRHHGPVRATVIGTAAARDLALIRVPLTDLVPLAIGRSSTMRLGDEVLAIGFPLNLGGGPTVTRGIVSGLDRAVHADGEPGLTGMLQTDAAINPGNSGGPLIDDEGRLVGINTIGDEHAENVGFAIAIDGAKPVIAQIRARPVASRAWIGVSFSSISTQDAAVQLGVPPATRGAAVVSVLAGSPAARAGLEEGDVVVASGDTRISSAAQMATALGAIAPGRSLVLDVVDSSGPRRVTVTSVAQP
jgi:S1-C subfamily serine protease